MVYVIIVTYNGLKWIDKCLSSLSGDSAVNKVIVIDNGSTDGTVNCIEENFPTTTLIKNPHNSGFGQANNLGMKIAIDEGADHVFLLKQDAWIEECAITKLVKIQQRDRRYGILSPIHLRGDGAAVDMKYGMFVMSSENTKLFSDLYLHRDNLNDAYSVTFVNAAAWLISRECLEIVGGFSPVFFHYGEDMGYANRVIYHDFKIGICPGSIIYHDRKNFREHPDISTPKEYLTIKTNLHLISLTNINGIFIERYAKVVYKVVTEFFKWLFKGDFKKASISGKELIIVLRIFFPIRKNSILVKRRNGAYLLENLSVRKMSSSEVEDIPILDKV
jgi:GT2 family glycosyltransferase